MDRNTQDNDERPFFVIISTRTIGERTFRFLRSIYPHPRKSFVATVEYCLFKGLQECSGTDHGDEMM